MWISKVKRPLLHVVFAAKRVLEVLPEAAPPEPRKLTETEKARLFKQEEATLRELRLFLRDTLNKLGRDRKFNLFAKPVDEEEVSSLCYWCQLHVLSCDKLYLHCTVSDWGLWSLEEP